MGQDRKYWALILAGDSMHTAKIVMATDDSATVAQVAQYILKNMEEAGHSASR